MGSKVLFVLIVALIATQTCTGENVTNSDEQTSDGPVINTEKSPLEKGMEPVFKMCHNFLDLVMPKNFYSESDTPFNVLELTRIVKENDYVKIQTDWQDLVKTFGGLAGCIVVGLIFYICMPIAGMIYCCCHCCCHKCGGTKEMMDPKHAPCKRWTLTVLLLICTTLMLAGGIIVFLGSDLLHQSLQNDENRGLVGRMDHGLDDFQTFVNSTLSSIDEEITDKVIRDGLNKILPEIEGAAHKTVERIKDTINAAVLLDQARSLGDSAVKIADNLAQLGPLLTNLQELQTNVSDTLQDVNATVATACTGFEGLCKDVNDLKFLPNFGNLDVLSNQTTAINGSRQISTFVKQASDSFNNISEEINSEVNTQITDAKKEITHVNNTINTQVKSLEGKADPVNEGIKSVQDSVKGDVNDALNVVAKYVWYTCIGLGCAVLLIVFFYFMGVLYGLCGERPGHRAGCCNRGTGAGLLCGGICCSFFFAWVLMQFVVLMFMVGGLTYSLGCKYTNDGVENIGDMESLLSNGLNINLSEALGFNGESNLTVAAMLRDCKDNKGIYSALHLKNLFDIDKEFNISGVLLQVDDIKSQFVSVGNVGNIQLLPTELKTQLENFKDSSIANVNFTDYLSELSKDLFSGTDLKSVILQLRQASDNVRSTDSQKLNSSADKLETLQNITIAAIEKDVENLTSIVTDLRNEAQVSVPAKITDLINNISKSQKDFDTDSVRITQEELNKTVDTIKALIVNATNDAKNAIKHNIGKCRPLYDGVQATVDAVCIITIDPFNAIWFGLGWSLFFFIPCIIFAALLSSLYKRSEKYKQKSGDFDDPIRSHHSGEYDNGYRGGRQDDNVPLTSMGKDQRPSSNGAYNYGYQGRANEHNSRHYRDSYPNYPPEHQSYDRGAPRESRLYAEPHMDPYDRPPLYDDAISPQYDRVGHNGYSGGRRY